MISNFMTNYRETTEYIRQQLERVSKAKMESLLLEGLNSGDVTKIRNEWWDQKLAQLVKKHRG
jgi:antitoxin ParD1/3/4